MTLNGGYGDEMEMLLEESFIFPEWVKKEILNGWYGKWHGNEDGYLNLNGYSKEMTIYDDMMPELLQCLGLLGDAVKRLSLHSNSVTSAGVEMLFGGLRARNPTIKQYLLSANPINDDCLKIFGEFLKINKSIRDVNMSWTNITDAGVETLLPYIDGNFTFKRLDLDGNKGITEKSVPLFLKMIESSHIEHIGINDTSISLKNILAVPLRGNKLKNGSNKLEIFEKDVNDEDMIRLCEYIKQYGIKKLKEINIARNKITSKGASILFETLKRSNSVVSELNLSFNQLDGHCMQQLGEYLIQNDYLEKLDMSYSNLTDKAIKILSEHFVGNNTLKEIILSGNDAITDGSVPYLIDIAKKSGLEKLIVWGTSISFEKEGEISKNLTLPAEHLKELANALKNGEGAKIYRAKIMTAGDGGAGKTSTIRSLTGLPFIQEHISTIGADTTNDCRVKLDTMNSHFKLKSNEIERDNLSSKHQAIALKEKRKRTDGEESASISKQFHQDSSFREPTENSNLQTKQISCCTSISSFCSTTFNKLSILNSSKSSKKAQSSTRSMTNHPSPLLTGKNEELGIDLGIEETIISLKGNMVKKMFNDDGLESDLTISIWDLGGQKVFYAIHHLFLSDYAVYLVVFNMTQLVSTNENSREETLESIHFWLQSINMHASKAKVFLIGTFKDVVYDHHQHQQIDETLLQIFDARHVNKNNFVTNMKDDLLFWPLDNSLGPDSDDIKELRLQIMNVTSKQEYLEETVPLRWTSTLDELIQAKKSHVTFEEFKLFAEFNQVNDKDEQLRLLRKFHQLGILLFFDKENNGGGLSDIIVLDPQWLVDGITKLIRHFDLHDYDDETKHILGKRVKKDFERLKDESIASVELMNILWRDEDEKSEKDFTRRNYLLSIMEKMSLAAPWIFDKNEINNTTASASSSLSEVDIKANLDVLQSTKATHYLIPANLRLFGEEITKKRVAEINKRIEIPKLDGNVQSNKSDCFIIDFSDGFLPIGFFDKLLCLLVGYSSLCFSDNTPPITANGSAFLSFDDSHFRIDEKLNQSRIIVSFAKDCEAGLILKIVESLVEQLRIEMMRALPKYKIFVIVWRNEGKQTTLIDVEKVRNAVLKKKKTVHDKDGESVELIEIRKAWFCKLISAKNSDDEFEERDIIAFLSHMKEEAGKDARILKDYGEKYLLNIEGSFKRSKLYLDSDYLKDLRKLIDEVKKMKVMIVLLSKSYLTRPWCLVEIYTAINLNIPVVAVNIIGGGYDFDKAREFLQSLTPETLDKANNGASKTLQDIGIDITEMGRVLYSVLPKVIAQEFNANANTKIINTQVEIIMEEMIGKL